MTAAVEHLLREAESLSREEREELALLLLDGIEPDPGYDEELEETIRRRVAEIDAGSVRLVPASELFARMDSATRGER